MSILKVFKRTRISSFNILTYFAYVMTTDVFPNNIKRWWTHYGSPFAIVKNKYYYFQRLYREWKKIDRRKKQEWSNPFWVVNRDGDYHYVECSICHNGLYFNEVSRTFYCNRCNVIVNIYKEDGVVQMRDHRDGEPILPSYIVEDDNGIWHLGIAEDAPWWWKRRELYRDLHDGWDAHHHYEYMTEPIPHTSNNGFCEAESPQPTSV